MTEDNKDAIEAILNQLDKEKAESEKKSEKTPVKASTKQDDTEAQTTDLSGKMLSEIKKAEPKPVSDNDAQPVRRVSEAPSTADAESKSEKRPPIQRKLPRTQGEEDIPMRNMAAIKRNSAHHKPTKKKKKRSNRLPGVLLLTVMIFAVSICLSLVIIAFGKDILGIGKSTSTKMIIIPEDSNTEEISQLLYDEGIINSPKCFKLFSKLRNDEDNYLAGEHFVSPSMAYETIIKTLTTVAEEEQKAAVSITFTEGMNIYDAADLLQENNVCNAAEFLYNFNAAGFGFEFEKELPTDYNQLKYADSRMEGYLFPDTYTFTVDMAPEQVCQKIYYNFNQKLDESHLKRMKELNLSIDQLITLSSIVQHEAPTREDMTHVASVFWNRLEQPEAETVGKLQSDPTKNYAYKVIKPRLAVPNQAMLDAYDTYICTGLPPGAICNPGLEAIDAVLEKAPTEDFYFIANTYTGETFFSKTLDEHNQKAAQIAADMALWEEEEAARKAEEEANAN